MKWFWKKAKKVKVPHPIQLLPRELRGEIFNKLEKKDVSNVRCVCKQWAQDAKDYYNYDISLNEDSRGLDYILQLRIVSLEIRELNGRRITIFPDPCDQASRQLTFKYPNLIRRIEVTSGRNPISLHCLQDLLMLCQENLTHIKFEFSSSFGFGDTASKSKNELPQTRPFQFQLPNLQSCHLNFDLGPYISDATATARHGGTTPGSFVWSTIVSSKLPKLQELRIFLKGRVDGDGILRDLVKLMTKNPKGLERLEIDVMVETLGLAPQQLSSSELLPLDQLDRIRKITIAVIQFTGQPEHDYIHWPVFNNLVRQQRNLEKLDLSYYIPISADFVRSIILRNFETVAIVKVWDLIVSAEIPFDLSVFKNCSNLKKLKLASAWSSVRTEPPIGPQLVNLGQLPNGIVSLQFANINILSREILRLLNSEALPRLEMLLLDRVRVGPYADFGANSAVMAKMKTLSKDTWKDYKGPILAWQIIPIHLRRK